MTTARVAAVCAALLLVGLVAMLAGDRPHPDYRTCQAYFSARIGHPQDDGKFWDALAQCASDGNLPYGYNDPALYR